MATTKFEERLKKIQSGRGYSPAYIRKTVDELLDLLVDISDSDDFIKAVVGAAGNDDNRERIIKYIKAKKKKGIIPNTSRLLTIAVYLGKNNR